MNDNSLAETDRPESPHHNAVNLVYTTFPTLEDAKKTGGALVERGLAACVNILPQMTSIFSWEGKIEEDSEIVMIVKTTGARVQEVMGTIRELHPYSVPALMVIPVAGGGEDFLSWIAEQCASRAQA